MKGTFGRIDGGARPARLDLIGLARPVLNTIVDVTRCAWRRLTDEPPD